MKTAYLTGIRQLEIRDEPEPRLQRPGDVLVRIDRVGVCGSDVHYYVSGRIGYQVCRYPATVGHECAGTVLEVGAEVDRVRPGDRVAVDPAFACGRCDQCLAGRANTCRNVRFMGCPGEAAGAVAEYHVVPAENCFPVPSGVTLEQAALSEPLSVGLYAVRLGQLAPGMRIAVLGAGPIGLSVLLCAKALGPCTSYVTDRIDTRLAVARRCGADWTGNATERATHAAIVEQEPRGLDLVFECSGDPACIDQAIELLAPGATLAVVGIPEGDRMSFDPHVARRKELVFRNVRRQNDCVADVIELIAGGRINTGPLHTHSFPLERIGDAFETVAGYRDGVIKAIIDVA